MPENAVPDQDPPLVDVKVTNPVTYLKKWWNKVIGNEGMEFRFRVKPLTAIAISLVVVTVAFGLGQVDPTITTKPIPTPTPEVWRETAYTGTLQFSDVTGRYYLVTTSAEAITLEVPDNFDLKDLVGRRVFAAGNYNKAIKKMIVSDASDMEVLSKKPVSIPLLSPSPTPTMTATPSAQPTPTQTPSQTPAGE